MTGDECFNSDDQPGSSSFRWSVIQYCKSPLAEDVVHRQEGGRAVVKFRTYAIKFGLGVCEAEAANLQRASKLTDPRILKVPRFMDYFQDQEDELISYGYLVMEFVQGLSLAELNYDQSLYVLEATKHLLSISGDVPGNLEGGPFGGRLFCEASGLLPGNIDALENWINERSNLQDQICLSGEPLVLCHLDIHPRNILWPKDGPPCLVDWESAGFAPRVFEFCSHEVIGRDDTGFHGKFLEMLRVISPLTRSEEKTRVALLQAVHHSIKFYVPDNSQHLTNERSSRSYGAENNTSISYPAPPPLPTPPPWAI